MSIIALSTRRRVSVAMVAVLFIVFGAIALSELKVNLLPELSYPSLTVRTELEGAASLEVEKLLSQPIEEQLGVVKGLQRIKSVSRAGQSDVLLEFFWGTDMNDALLEVREKIELLQLPLEADRPILLRFNPSTDPIMRLALADENATEGFDETALKELRRFADDELKKELEPIDGVAAVKISGGLEDEVQIALQQQRLSQLGITVEQISQRLSQENINLSGGRLEQGTQRYLVRTVNQFQNVEEFGDLIIRADGGRSVYLRDVAQVSQAYKERQAVIRHDGREAVEIAIYKEGDSNTVAVAQAVERKLRRLKNDKLVPDDYQLEVIDDQSIFIDQAIGEVASAAFLGGILAVMVVYFFLGNAWSTAIISASIPLSIIATFFLMHQANLSLNIMSLGGVALAIGLLVDNAIVVLENIARHRSQGTNVNDAAVRGASEVGSAVFASTLTTIAVFFPLVFVDGIGGQLFRDQALTVTFALAISLVVALTVIPMMSSLGGRSPVAFPDEDTVLPTPKTAVGRGLRGIRYFLFHVLPHIFLWLGIRIGRGVSTVFRWLLKPASWAVMGGYQVLAVAYSKVLPIAMRARLLVVMIAIGAMLATLAIVPNLGAELIPQLAQGRVEMRVKLAPGAPLEQTDTVVAALQEQALTVDSISSVFAVSGSGNRIDANPTEAGENIGDLLIVLADGSEPTEQAAVTAMRQAASAVPGVISEFSRPQLLNFSTPLEIEIKGYELGQLKALSAQVAERLGASDRFTDVRSTMEAGHPEIQVVFDQERVAALGMTVRQIADQVVKQIRGDVATRFSFRDRKIDVLVRAQEADRSSIEDVRSLIVNPTSSRPLPLAAVADIIVTEGPAEITRLDQQRSAIVSANLAFGTLKEATLEAQEILDELPATYGFDSQVAGQSEQMEASFKSLMFALGLAVFLVYLVMASQFESLVQPFVIMLTVPLASVGAVGMLWLTGTPLSVIVFIGFIMLAGIVVNNAIVLLDLINQLRAQGMQKREAILEAAQSRLRPIVMTTLTTALGLMPLALGLGEGSEVRAPMALTVIGGLTVSTLLTLIVIPVVYDLMVHGKPRVLPTTDQSLGAELTSPTPQES